MDPPTQPALRGAADTASRDLGGNEPVHGEYIVRRLLQIVPLLLGISVLGFSLMHLAPGGPTAVYATNPNVTAEDIARIRAAWGLDDPLPQQYLRWAGNLVTGDFGNSYRGGAQVRAPV